MYKICGISTDGVLNMVYAQTNHFPLCNQNAMLPRQCNFLKARFISGNKIARFIFTSFGRVELEMYVQGGPKK